jgi:hypothetical protein
MQSVSVQRVKKIMFGKGLFSHKTKEISEFTDLKKIVHFLNQTYWELDYEFKKKTIITTNKCFLEPLSPQHGASNGCGWRNGLQLGRLAANILNKQPRTDNRGWSSSLGVGRGVSNSSP